MHLNLLVIKSRNMQAAASFYASLGMHFEHHRHGQGPFHYAAKIEEVVFEIYPLKDDEVADSTVRLGFTVNALDSFVKKLQTEGIKILKEPAMTPWGYTCLVEDPDGRKVELKQAS